MHKTPSNPENDRNIICVGEKNAVFVVECLLLKLFKPVSLDAVNATINDQECVGQVLTS